MVKKLLVGILLLLSACGTTPYPWEVLEGTDNCLGPFGVKDRNWQLEFPSHEDR